MSDRTSRRRFLGAAGPVAAAGVLLGPGHGGADDKKGARDKRKPFQGTSKKGLLQEALDDAIATALRSAAGADRMVEWSLKEVTGREGGIAGFNEVTVTIEASVS